MHNIQGLYLFKVIDMKQSTATTYYCSFTGMMQLHESQSTARARLKSGARILIGS